MRLLKCELKKYYINCGIWKVLLAFMIINLAFSIYVVKSFPNMKENHEGYSTDFEEITLIDILLTSYENLPEYNPKEYGAHITAILEENRHQASMIGLINNEDAALSSLALAYDAYRKLGEIMLPDDELKEVGFMLDNRLKKILLIVYLLLTVAGTFLVETDSGMRAFIFTTKSKKKVFWCKYAVCIFAGEIFWILSNLSDYLVAGLIYGFHSVLVPVQSITGFINSPYHMSVLEFLVVYFMLTLLWNAALVSVISVCFSIFSDWVTGNLMLGFLVVVNIAIHVSISEWSYLVAVKNLSLLNGGCCEKFFSEWNVLRIGNNVIQLPYYLIFSFLIWTIWGMVMGFRFWTNSHNPIAFNKLIFFKKKEKRISEEKSKTDFLDLKRIVIPPIHILELKKIFLHRRLGIIVIFMLILESSIYMPRKWYIDEVELYYQNYSKTLEGRVTEEKKKDFEKKCNELRGHAADYEKLKELLDKGEISQSYMDYAMSSKAGDRNQLFAIDRIERQLESLSEITEGKNDVEYVMLTPYRYLFGFKHEYLTLALLFLIAVMLGSFSLAHYERVSGMKHMISLYPKGRKTVIMYRKKGIFLFVCLCFLATYMPHFCWVYRNFGFVNFKIPAWSLSMIIKLPWNIPFAFYFIGYIGVLFLIAFQIAISFIRMAEW